MHKHLRDKNPFHFIIFIISNFESKEKIVEHFCSAFNDQFNIYIFVRHVISKNRFEYR